MKTENVEKKVKKILNVNEMLKIRGGTSDTPIGTTPK
jgi:hypothetical protein